MDIKYYPNKTVDECKFSIIIPTWNNLNYLKLCVDSIKKNSSFKHQIILHINAGSDGTLEWAKREGLDYSFSEDNIGICFAVNAAASLARAEYIVYMNDDMYVCPDWDLYLWEEIVAIGHDLFFISATMIEPTESRNPCVIFSPEFGSDITDFEEKKLLENFDKFEKDDWCGSTWPPNVVSRKIWQEIGGYSIEFSPGMYSDPDFSMKLWVRGVRYFKGVGKSRVYHFQCKTTGRIVKNDGKTQFKKKWLISGSKFVKKILRRGQVFSDSVYLPQKK